MTEKTFGKELIDSVNESMKNNSTNKVSNNTLEIAGSQGSQPPCVIKLRKIDSNAAIPVAAHNGDIGYDLTVTDIGYEPGTDTYIYHTGIAIEGPADIINLVLCRSSNTKTEFYLPNGVGLIDINTYRGEIILKFKHRDNIETRAMNRLIKEYFAMPWYKRIFKTPSVKDYISYERNPSNAFFKGPYAIGDRIGQLIFFKKADIVFEEVDELSETERGADAFGSTNK